MQQILASHDIPARVVNQGISPHFGCGTPAALQVQPQNKWTALLLVSPIDDAQSEPTEQ